MATEKDFRVKKGLIVENGDVTLSAGNLSLASGYAAIDNIKIDTNTISSTNTDGDITLSPQGNGKVTAPDLEVNDSLTVNAGAAILGVTAAEKTLQVKGAASQSAYILSVENNAGGTLLTTTAAGLTTASSFASSNVDINGGNIDGSTIATSDITVGTGKTLDVSSGTLTLANDQISGDKVEGGTIAATTITALTTAGITASADIDIGNFDFQAKSFTSDVATGTAPLVVTSTTEVANLNAAALSGADWDAPLAIGGTTPAAGTFTAIVGTSLDLNGNLDVATQATSVVIKDNQADAFRIAEGINSYLSFDTVDGSELIKFSKDIDIDGHINLDTQATNISLKDDTGSAFKIKQGSNDYIDIDTTDSTELIKFGVNVDINGGYIDGTPVGNSTPALGKFTTIGATSHATINGTARESKTRLQVNGDAYASPSNTNTTLDYVEARLHTDIANDDLAGATYANIGNMFLLDNAENVAGTGQGVAFTVGRSGTGSVWGIGRQESNGVFHIGYRNRDFDADAGGAGSVMKAAQGVLQIDTSGNVELTKNGATLAFTGETSGGTERLIKFKASSNGITAGGDVIYTLPVADGSSGNVLKTDGSGTLSWGAATASGTVDASGTPVNDQLGIWVDEDTLEGNANLTYTTSGLKVGQTGINSGAKADFTAYSGNSGRYLQWDSSAVELGLVGLNAKLSFYDLGGGENISADNAGKLSINAGIELEITSPTLDLNASTAVTIDTATSTITSSTSHTIDTPSLIITDDTASEPIVQIKNTANDATGGELRFVMDKGAAGAADDVSGSISFYADDAAQNNQSFARIQGSVNSPTSGSESGKIGFAVATTTTGALADVMTIVGGAAGASSTVTVKGNLTVEGTTVTVNSTTIDVADININLGNGVGNDSAVDGGGITLESTDTNKTLNWVDSTDSWTSSEHIDLASGRSYKIAGTAVLNATTLLSGVTGSSLTSVGTLNSGAISSGFGAIDIGTSTLAAGAITGSSLDVTGNIEGNGTLSLNNGSNIISAGEINVLDGVTAGTVSASKALVVDSNRDLSSIRNLTSDGAVQGATISVDAVAVLDSGRASASSITGATALYTWAHATYKTVKFVYQIKKDSAADTDVGEILVTYNGTNAYMTEYGVINTGTEVGTWDAIVVSGNIELRFTPANNGAHTYSITATQLIA